MYHTIPDKDLNMTSFRWTLIWNPEWKTSLVQITMEWLVYVHTILMQMWIKRHHVDFCLLTKFWQDMRWKIKIWKWSDFGLPKVRKINHQICIFGFHCVAKNMKGWLRICISYFVYNKIIPMDGHHFGFKKIPFNKHWQRVPTIFMKQYASCHVVYKQFIFSRLYPTKG
jgi:hypothetical protein